MNHLDAFVPHGVCLLWTWPLILLIIAGNLATFLAYSYIPVEFIRAGFRGRVTLAPKARMILFDFAAFILFCGVGHLWQIFLIWNGGLWYWVEAVWTLGGTAVFSWRALGHVSRGADLYMGMLGGPVDFDRLLKENTRLTEIIRALEERLGG